MTDVVDPSVNKAVDDRLQSVGQRYSADDWVVPTDRDLAASRIGLTGTPLNAFDITTSTSSLDVTIGTGEAVVEGKYLAKDATTTVSLSSDTANQTIYVGANDADTNNITIGLDGDFSGDFSRIAIWGATTDASGVTSTTDRRRIGEPIDGTWHRVAEQTFTSTSTNIDYDTGTLPRAWDRYRVIISHENHDSGEQYLKLRVNGITTSDYRWDAVRGEQNDMTSKGPESEWQDLAGADGGGIAHQTLEVARPRAESPPSNQRAFISIVTPGVARQRDHLDRGNMLKDPGLIDQLRVFGGSNSTGRIRILGADA